MVFCTIKIQTITLVIISCSDLIGIFVSIGLNVNKAVRDGDLTGYNDWIYHPFKDAVFIIILVELISVALTLITVYGVLRRSILVLSLASVLQPLYLVVKILSYSIEISSWSTVAFEVVRKCLLITMTIFYMINLTKYRKTGEYLLKRNPVIRCNHDGSRVLQT